jgi:hypothetical protein
VRAFTRLALAAVLAGSFAATAAPASANDCSNPKNPCGGCSLNTAALERGDVTHLIVCHPV